MCCRKPTAEEASSKSVDLHLKSQMSKSGSSSFDLYGRFEFKAVAGRVIVFLGYFFSSQ